MTHHQNFKMLKTISYCRNFKITSNTRIRKQKSLKLEALLNILTVLSLIVNPQRVWIKKIWLPGYYLSLRAQWVYHADLSKQMCVSNTWSLCDFYGHHIFKEKDWYMCLMQCEQNSQEWVNCPTLTWNPS